MSSTGINYVLNEYEDVVHYGPFAIPTEKIPYQNYPDSLVNQNDSGTNCVPNEYEDVDQYDSYTIPSKTMLCEIHPGSLVDLFDKLMELSC